MAPPSLHLIQAGTTEKEELAIFDPSTGEWQLALKSLPEERVGLACGPVKRYVTPTQDKLTILLVILLLMLLLHIREPQELG